MTTLITPAAPLTPSPAAVDWHMGALMTWHVTAADSAGALSLGEVLVRQGGEPPLHVHAHEDETWFVLDGAVLFQRGAERLLASAGDAVLMPRGIAHGFAVLTPTARLLHAYTPGGLDEAFRAVSTPAEWPGLPEAPGVPDAAVLERMAAVFGAHGVTFVGPPLPVVIAAEDGGGHPPRQ
ncbi:hypothetical protein TBR22_A09390 [Luteitalea sp. TBR-22]|uniref:cupin domain-containing protein n=1 Tax=Luteitalea sp. TBR-22 TaxID=2802971 RepID=UPI001AF0A136|nr:cupin domain-containing protein [Luteitalea sp. TBR-22]BCS31735.1 hypothetical protein TBR22_A09390 [Luteitalea sp. TBR-22]